MTLISHFSRRHVPISERVLRGNEAGRSGHRNHRRRLSGKHEQRIEPTRVFV